METRDVGSDLDRQRPKVVFLGKGSFGTVGQDLQPKLQILGELLDPIVVGAERPDAPDPEGRAEFVGIRRRRGFLDSVLFYGLGPWIAVGRARRVQAKAIVCQSPYEGAGALFATRLRRCSVPVVVELHGDWRTAARLYGSPARRVLAPMADRVALWALRRADRVRVVAAQLEELARRSGYAGEIDTFVTYSNFGAFLDDPPEPLPSTPTLLFVGSFEPYKGVDILLEAWRQVAARVPTARLRMVGDGPLVSFAANQVVTDGTEATVEFVGALPTRQVKEALDNATALVLASRSEGLPRVILEAFARGRCVIATDVGGIKELVRSGESGELVEPGVANALANAIERVLAEPSRARSLGEEARRIAIERDPLREYRAGIARLAAWARQVG